MYAKKGASDGNVPFTLGSAMRAKEDIYKSSSHLQLLVVTMAIVSVSDNRLGGLDSLGGDTGNLLGHFFGHGLVGGFLNRLLGGLDASDFQQLGLEDYVIN